MLGPRCDIVLMPLLSALSKFIIMTGHLFCQLNFEKLSREIFWKIASVKNLKKQTKQNKKKSKRQNSISIFVEIIGCTSENLLIKGPSKIVFQEFLQIFS